jgi:hypothetical protein
LVLPVIRLARAIRKLERPARARQFPRAGRLRFPAPPARARRFLQPARRVPPGAGHDRDHDRHDVRDGVRLPDFAGAQVDLIPLVVFPAFPVAA